MTEEPTLGHPNERHQIGTKNIQSTDTSTRPKRDEIGSAIEPGRTPHSRETCACCCVFKDRHALRTRCSNSGGAHRTDVRCGLVNLAHPPLPCRDPRVSGLALRRGDQRLDEYTYGPFAVRRDLRHLVNIRPLLVARRAKIRLGRWGFRPRNEFADSFPCGPSAAVVPFRGPAGQVRAASYPRPPARTRGLFRHRIPAAFAAHRVREVRPCGRRPVRTSLRADVALCGARLVRRPSRAETLVRRRRPAAQW